MLGKGCGMRHLVRAATMLAVALGVTFGAASALESIALARDHGVRNGQFEVIQAAEPEMKSANSNRHVTSLVR
jgi:hypothetical protein